MRVATGFLAALLLSSSLNAEPVPERPKPAYPHTRATDLVEPQFGVPVADPYRWLENDVRTDKDVASWVVSRHCLRATFLPSG
jgi:prolyl oligopeptidase